MLGKLFCWQPTKETLIAFASGLLCVGLSSVALLLNNLQWARIVIRDLGQVFLLGLLFPLLYIQHSSNGWNDFGFNSKRWPLNLAINFALGTLLLVLFLFQSPVPQSFHLSDTTLWSMAYVVLTLCFELVFFYAFLRTLFERAFGIIPSIILTSLFYAFHHIGFQPEYGKLVFVGILYATTFRIANSALLVFPFFLGVGGTYDVLVQSKSVSAIAYPEARALCLLVLELLTVFILWRRKPRTNQP